MLETEFKYYRDHQEELVSQHGGKFIVIVGEKVISSYASDLEAYFETQKSQPIGTFLIQHCSPGYESYTRTFHSRLSIPR